jgi:hypothetical protein
MFPVTAITPLRTSSITTGSTGFRAALLFVVMFVPCCNHRVIPPDHSNKDHATGTAMPPDLRDIAWHVDLG